MGTYWRAFFHWSYSQFFIGGLFAAGVAMLTYDHFLPSYIFFCAAGLWALAYWQVSDHLVFKATELQKRRRKHIQKPDQQKALIAFKRARYSYYLSNISGSLILLLLMMICLAWTRSAQSEYELGLPSGWLIPANDDSPQSNCSPDAGDLAIYIGTIAAVSHTFPHTVIEYKKQKMLVIDRNEKNEIAVTVEVRGPDNKIIATIDKNEFNLTQNALQTHKPRPDNSTLLAYDEYGNQVLNVRFLNPHAIRISGTLYYGGQRIDMPIHSFYDTCSKESGVDISIQ